MYLMHFVASSMLICLSVVFSFYNLVSFPCFCPREVECNDKTQSRSSHTQRRSSQGRHGTQRDTSSPKRGRSSEKTHSSPKRRCSVERTHSSPKRKCSSERTHSSPNIRHLSERTHSSRSRDINEQDDCQKSKQSSSTSSQSRDSSSFSAKNKPTKASAGIEENRSVNNIDGKSMNSDGDLEGLEVTVDNGEELVHDIDKYSHPTHNQENLLSEPMDITVIHTEEHAKTGEDSANADTSEPSTRLKDGQKFLEEHEIIEVV